MGAPEIVIRVSFVAILIKLALATNYIVGGPNGGWDTSSNLQSWASSQKFSVGDSLIFQYPPNHNVVEVTKADYDSCQPTNPIHSYNDGSTTVPLTSPGKRYFICGTIGHCSQGMKVEIDTLASATSSATPAVSPSPEGSSVIPSTAPEESTLSPAVSPSPEGSSVIPFIPSTAPEESTLSPAESPEDIPIVPTPMFETHLESPTFSPVIPSTEFPAAASPLAQQQSPDLSASSTRNGNLRASVAAVLSFLMMCIVY